LIAEKIDVLSAVLVPEVGINSPQLIIRLLDFDIRFPIE
jgi:hypothetical protein